MYVSTCACMFACIFSFRFDMIKLYKLQSTVLCLIKAERINKFHVPKKKRNNLKVIEIHA